MSAMIILDKYRQIYLLILLLTVTVACDDGTNPQPQVNPQEVVPQSWNVDDVLVDNTSQGSQNAQANFTEGGQYTLIIPDLDGLGTTGNWEFNSDQSAIILNDGSLEVIAEIEEIENDRLVLEFDFENYKGDITTYRITLTR